MRRLFDEQAWGERPDGLIVPDRRLVAPKVIDLRAWGPGSFGSSMLGRKSSGAAPAISYVGEDEGSAGSSSLSIGSTGRAAGDLILWSGGTAGNSSPPGAPAGYADIIDAGTTNGSGASDCSQRACWKYSDGTETTFGSSLASVQCCIILRGVHASSPIGNTDRNSGNTTTPTHGSVTITAATSWVVTFQVLANSGATTDPSGMTLRTGLSGSSVRITGWTIGPVASFSSRTTTTTTGRWIVYAIEVLVSA
jgi:hypothetical protein